MEERVEDVLRRYELEILRAYRVRGSYVLETRQGIYLYKGYGGTEARAVYEAAIQRCLVERGFDMVDLYLPNEEGNYLSYDVMGEAHVVKQWFLGEECDLKETADLIRVSERLAGLHLAMSGMRGELGMEIRPREYSLEEQQRKHLRELQRVKAYIRNKKERNPFEVVYLQCADRIYAQGAAALEFLGRLQPAEYQRMAEERGDFYHGNYTYHNLILQPEGVAVVQYDKSWLGLQLLDIYYLLRKSLEKNEWRMETGEDILAGYQRVKSLTRDERQILYALLWFPDKYWKIANSYFNGKKSRIPGRNLVKLEEYLNQEESRERFLMQSRYRLFS